MKALATSSLAYLALASELISRLRLQDKWQTKDGLTVPPLCRSWTWRSISSTVGGSTRTQTRTMRTLLAASVCHTGHHHMCSPTQCPVKITDTRVVPFIWSCHCPLKGIAKQIQIYFTVLCTCCEFFVRTMQRLPCPSCDSAHLHEASQSVLHSMHKRFDRCRRSGSRCQAGIACLVATGGMPMLHGSSTNPRSCQNCMLRSTNRI